MGGRGGSVCCRSKLKFNLNLILTCNMNIKWRTVVALSMGKLVLTLI